MIPEELEKLIIRHKSEGHLPFFVNCTTGTTVYGAFDPIEPIADICEKYGIWLHIDVRNLVASFYLILYPTFPSSRLITLSSNDLILIFFSIPFHTSWLTKESKLMELPKAKLFVFINNKYSLK